MSWVAVPEMMEEDVELEEGEAGYFDSNDDKSIDPDVALSYIDDKLQSILGHFQKDFDGGDPAEKLGAVYGGYGSFLPMYQRSPSVRPQQKSPQRVQSNIARSPDRLHREVAARSSSIPDTTLRQRDVTGGPHIMPSLHDEKVTLGDDIHNKKEKDLSLEPVAKKLPPRYVPSPNKSQLNTNDQKTLKFRIKVGSGKSAQKNVAIYSGLGLDSPSSSHGNSTGGSGGVPCESRENCIESPTGILQMLSTLTDALGPLLSPLPDRFLNLLRDVPMEEKSTPILKDHSDSMLDDDHQVINKRMKINTSKKFEPVQEDDVLLRLKENSGAEALDSQKLQSDCVNDTGGPLRNSSKQPDSLKGIEKGIPMMKNKKLNNNKGKLSGADMVKDSVSGQDGIKFKRQEGTSSSVDKILTKDPPCEIPDSRRKDVNGVTSSAKMDSDTFKSGRESKGNHDHMLPKGGLRATSHEHEKSRIPPESKKKSKISQTNGKLPSDSKKSVRKDVSKARGLYEDLFEKSVDPVEKPFNNGPKASIDTVKNESVQRDIIKAKTKYNKVNNDNNQQTSESSIKDPFNYSVPSDNGLPLEVEPTTRALETDQTTSAPLWIEDWVQCDRCEQWRLLPYGRKPEQLPDKWVCSLLDWLPGMNRCDISEEATTTALHASYQLPLPDKQNLGNNIYAGNSDVISGNDVVNGSKNKNKVKGTSHKGSKQGVDMTTSAAKVFAESPVRRESLNDKKQLVNSGMKPSTNSIGQQHRNSSHNSVEKHSNNQKLEHRGEVKLKRKSKAVTDQYEQPITKKVKIGHTSDINESPISNGSLGRNEFHSNPSLPVVASVSDKKKPVEHSRTKDSKSEEGITTVQQRSSDGHMSLKKRKLMDWQNSQSNVMPLTGEDSDNGVGRIKKPMVSLTDVRIKVNDDVAAQKDFTIDKDLEREKQPKEHKIKVTSTLSKEDLESLKKTLISEQVPVAANSSSSKVSDSGKNRARYIENRGSPVESVSSSPLRMKKDDVKESVFPTSRSPVIKFVNGSWDSHQPRKIKHPESSNNRENVGNSVGNGCDLNTKETQERGFPPRDRQKILKPKKNSRVMPEVDQIQLEPSGSIKSSKAVVNKSSKKIVVEKRENGSKREHHNSVFSLKDSSPSDANVPNGGDEKPQPSQQHTQDKHEIPSTAPEPQKKNLLVLPPRDSSGCRESKDSGKAIHKNESLEGSAHSVPDGPIGPSFSKSIASIVLQEAEGFRDYADRLKDTGFEYECNETYFQAALKFLHGASLLERTNGSRKHDEMNQTQIYINSAKLCETCGEEYERRDEMAAAALAYKCMEVAYMRVVYCKNITVNRLCHDLPLTLQMVPQGESPSSSASDIDNLNNHALVEKSSFSKSNGTHVENNVLASRSRSNFARILDFTKYVNLAMEASMKYQNALATANVMLEEAQNKNGIVSVKRVIDFSFHDVDELVRLVGLAKEATINRKAFRGSRN